MKKKKTFWSNPVVKTILMLIGAFLLMNVGGAIGLPLGQLLSLTGNSVLAFAGHYLTFLGIWIAIFLVWCKKKNRPMFRALGREAKGNNWKTSLGFGLACGLGLNLILAVCAMLNGDIKVFFNRFDPLYILLFIVVIAIQSGAEELVCRAHIYQNLRRYWPALPVVAVLGNAVFFSVTHLFNPGINVWALLDIAFTGIMFSLLVYYFDSFWAPVVAHTGWNFCQNILLGLPNSGIVSAYSVFKLDAANARNSFFYDTAFGIEGTAAAVVLESLVCLILWQVGKRRNQKPLDIWALPKPDLILAEEKLVEGAEEEKAADSAEEEKLVEGAEEEKAADSAGEEKAVDGAGEEKAVDGAGMRS